MSSVPYIGCKISLVSKSEIRYEGILYTIDTKESTVALAKVRSCGTEGRPTDRPVAPRDEIYEYIIFRASDIKDLHVCEAPKSQPVISGGLPNDPAIVQHSAPVATCGVQYGQAYGHVCGVPPFQHLPSTMTFPHVQQPLLSSHASGSRSGTSLQTSQRKNATTDAGVQVSSDLSIKLKDERESQETIKQSSRENSQTRQGGQSQRGSFSNRRFQRGRGPRRGRGRGRNFSIQRTVEALKFDSEYDFELANAEFIELENKLSKDEAAVDTLAGGDTEEDSGAYNREKSFFDNISCEASRVAKGIPRFDWRVERKLNVETFGVSLSNNWLRRRRGRGGFRGRGGRGRGAITTALTKANETPSKVVTFGDQLVSVEIERPETPITVAPIEEIPVIEIVPSKDVVWEESDASKEQWNIPRFDWRVERKLNVETFGVSLSNNWLRRRRGRGGFRGRGGRGRGAITTALTKANETPSKVVTFGDQLVSVEIERPETPITVAPIEEIPVIEIVPSKDVVWEESDASKEQWNIPRFDWRVERKLNVETFGVSLSNNWLRRRRGRGGFRGRGGRGRGAITTALTKANETPSKVVTFGDQLVSVEIERPETPITVAPIEEIPVIEIVPSKDVVWEESDASKEQWK